mgnify:CR=1 FL=1
MTDGQLSSKTALKSNSQLLTNLRGIVAQWLAHLTHNWWMPVGVSLNPIKDLFPVEQESNNPECLVLVGSRNRFKRDLHKENCLFLNQNKNKLI